MALAVASLDSHLEVGTPDLEVVVGDEVTERRRRSRWDHGWTRALSPIVIVVVWQLLCNVGVFTPFELASPVGVAKAFGHLMANGVLEKAIGVSLVRVGLGLAIGLALGVALAVAAGLSRVGERLIDTPIQAVRTLPFLAMLPLFIVWFGIGQLEKVGIVAFAAMFPVYLNTYGGIRNVDGRLVEAGKILGLSRLRMVRDVILPGAMPNFLIGLRMALTVSWLALVVAEQVNATSGLGYLMSTAASELETDQVMVGLAIYACLGLIADLIVRQLEKHVLSWRRNFAGE